MKCVRAVLVLLLFAAPSVTEAAPVLPGAPDTLPLLYVCVGVGGVADECLNLSGAVQPVAGAKTSGVEDLGAFFSIAQILISATYNPDPFITFSVTTMNLVPGPVTYGFLFGTQIVQGLYNVATSEGDVAITNGLSGTATVANSGIHSSYISGYGTLDFTPTNLGVDLGTASCTAGPGAPFVVTESCPQGTATNTFAPTLYNNLEALLTYTQSDTGSVATLTGGVTLEFDPDIPAVPEPTLLGLFGAAVLSFGVRRLRS